MDRDVFAARFMASAEAAWAFGREFLAEELPPALSFRVRLNQSYDGHPAQRGETRFPHDNAPHRAAQLNKCDAQTAVAELWRDGRVPEWINLAVVGETGAATVIEVVCCGRFTDDERRLYHAAEAAPLFHVLGPALPPRHGGGRFSIHLRAECWDQSDALHLANAAHEVWSFELRTDVFDSQLLAALPEMPNVEIFEHHACTLASNAMSAFTRFPKLQILRLHLTTSDSFRLGVDARDRLLGTLTDLTITNLPSYPWGHDTLATIAPAVTAVSFTAAKTLWLDGVFGPSVRNVTLAAANISGSTRLPAHLDRLGIHLAHGTDRDVATLLSGVTHLRSLSLRDTPVTDAIISVLDPYDLDSLDLVRTATTASALSRFQDHHPEVGLYPRTPPFKVTDLAIRQTPYGQV